MYVATRPLTLNGVTYPSGAVVDVATLAPRTIARLVQNRRLIMGVEQSSARSERRARAPKP